MKRTARAGFTLMEVMVAVLLLGVTLAGSLGLLSWMVHANRFSSQVTEAMTLNQAKIDELREQGFEAMVSGSDIYDLYRSLREPVAVEPEPEAGNAREEFDLDHELSRLVAQFGVDTRQRPIPDRMREEVERFIEFWTVEKRGFTERSIERGRPHLEMIRRELRAAQLPEVFCYLPFIESGYQDRITSTAKARGLWQFMPATGRAHGLRVDDEVDERTDPQKSTRAACSYLNSLLVEFGPNAFMCAVAAYNKGENGMRRCLKRSANWRSTWKFWDVVAANDGCLRQETVEYVPRFLAAAVVLRRPEVFGLAMN